MGYDTEEHAAEKRGNAFKQGFAEMNAAIKYGHGHDGIGAGIAYENDDKKAPEEKFDGDKVEPVGDFKQQFVGPGVLHIVADKIHLPEFGVSREKIMLGGSKGDDGYHNQQHQRIGFPLKVFG